jgi:hypothetical protein
MLGLLPLFFLCGGLISDKESSVSSVPMTHPELYADSGFGHLLNKVRRMFDPKNAEDLCRFLQDFGVGSLMRLPATSHLWWGQYQWMGSGEIILRFDDELAKALLETDLPSLEYDPLPNCPWKSMYISLSNGLFMVGNEVWGFSNAVGIYVTQDSIYYDGDMHQGYTISTVGSRDKTGPVATCGIIPGKDIFTGIHVIGNKEAIRFVMNFLILYNSLDRDFLSIQSHKMPQLKSEGKQKKLKRRGLSRHNYLYVTTRRLQTKSGATVPAPWEGPIHSVFVRGHWQRYWIRNVPEGIQILSEKEGKRGTLYQVWKYKAVFTALRRGEAKPGPTVRDVR